MWLSRGERERRLENVSKKFWFRVLWRESVTAQFCKYPMYSDGPPEPLHEVEFSRTTKHDCNETPMGENTLLAAVPRVRS